MARPSKDDGYEVSDSTDWLKTPLKSLAPVDAALRCQVCRDFYKTPMITSCAHTFCSICIRRCLSNDGKCPACRMADQELKLRNNWVMEELVDAFQNARGEVMEFARKPAPAPVEMATRKKSKRPREELLDGEDESPKKRTRPGLRRQQARDPTETETIEIQDSDGSDEEYVPEDGLVQCPICGKSMKEANINPHLDRGCRDPEEPRVTKALGKVSGKGSSQSRSTMSQNPIKRPERLPQINYSMVKDTSLRKKLTDMGISAGGTRQLMEKRYTEWITLWNANCDAKNPRGKSELKRELETWEKAQNGRSHASSSHGQIKDKDFDSKGWAATHDDAFRDLVEKARSQLPPKTKPKPPSPDSASANAEPSNVSTPSGALIPDSSESTPAKSNIERSDSATPRLEPMSLDASPSRPPSVRRSRFFEEKSSQDSHEPPPSSQTSARGMA